MYFFVRYNEAFFTNDRDLFFKVTIQPNSTDTEILDQCYSPSADTQTYPAQLPNGNLTSSSAPHELSHLRVFEYIFQTEGGYVIQAIPLTGYLRQRAIQFSYSGCIPDAQQVDVNIKKPAGGYGACESQPKFVINRKDPSYLLKEAIRETDVSELLLVEKMKNCQDNTNMTQKWMVEKITEVDPIHMIDLPHQCLNHRRIKKIDFQNLTFHFMFSPIPFSMTLTEFVVQPYLLAPGIYRICIMIPRESSTMTCGFIGRHIEDANVISELIRAYVTPAANSFFWPNMDLNLDATGSYFVYESPDLGFVGKPTLRYEWYCLGPAYSCHMVLKRILKTQGKSYSGQSGNGTLPISGPVFQLLKSTVDPGTQINFKLRIVARDLKSGLEGEAVILKKVTYKQFEQYTTPMLEIRCLINCWYHMDRDKHALLGLTCLYCQDFDRKHLTVKWTVLHYHGWQDFVAGRNSLYLTFTDFAFLTRDKIIVQVEAGHIPGRNVAPIHSLSWRVFSVPINEITKWGDEHSIAEATPEAEVFPRLHIRLSFEEFSSVNSYPILYTLLTTKGGHFKAKKSGAATTPSPIQTTEVAPTPKPDLTTNKKKGGWLCLTECKTACDDCDAPLACHQETVCQAKQFSRPAQLDCSVCDLYPPIRSLGFIEEVEEKKSLIQADMIILRTISMPVDVVFEIEKGADGAVLAFEISTAVGIEPEYNKTVQADAYEFPPNADIQKTFSDLQSKTIYDLTYLAPFTKWVSLEKNPQESKAVMDEVLTILATDKDNPINPSNINIVFLALRRFIGMSLTDEDTLKQMITVVEKTVALHERTKNDLDMDNLYFKAELEVMYAVQEKISIICQKVQLPEVSLKFMMTQIVSMIEEIVKHMAQKTTKVLPGSTVFGDENYRASGFWFSTNNSESISMEGSGGKVLIRPHMLHRLFTLFSVDTFLSVGIYISHVNTFPYADKDIPGIIFDLPLIIISMELKNPDQEERWGIIPGLYYLRFEVNDTEIKYKSREFLVYEAEAEAESNSTVREKREEEAATIEMCLLLQFSSSSKWATTIEFNYPGIESIQVAFKVFRQLRMTLDIFESDFIVLPRAENKTALIYTPPGGAINSIFLPPLTLMEEYGAQNKYYLMIKAEVNKSLDLSVEVNCSIITCVHWNKAMQSWSERHCRPVFFSELLFSPTVVDCSCDEGTIFSAGTGECPGSFNLTSSVWELVCGACHAEINSEQFFGVFLLIAFWIISIAVLYWARKRDIQDSVMGKINVVPSCFSPHAPDYFLICIVTGGPNKCRTTSIPCLCMIGAVGVSETFCLDTGQDIFQPSSESWFLVSSSVALGELENVVVSLVEKQPLPTWFVSHIYIRNLLTGEDWYCICDRWLPTRDERELNYFCVRPQRLFIAGTWVRNIVFVYFRLLKTLHMVFALAFALPGQSYTRVQHTLCTMCTVLGLMLGCFYFIGLPPSKLAGESDEEKEMMIEIIPTATMATLIVSVPSVLLSLLLAKASRKERRINWELTMVYLWALEEEKIENLSEKSLEKRENAEKDLDDAASFKSLGSAGSAESNYIDPVQSAVTHTTEQSQSGSAQSIVSLTRASKKSRALDDDIEFQLRFEPRLILSEATEDMESHKEKIHRSRVSRLGTIGILWRLLFLLDLTLRLPYQFYMILMITFIVTSSCIITIVSYHYTLELGISFCWAMLAGLIALIFIIQPCLLLFMAIILADKNAGYASFYGCRREVEDFLQVQLKYLVKIMKMGFTEMVVMNRHVMSESKVLLAPFLAVRHWNRSIKRCNWMLKAEERRRKKAGVVSERGFALLITDVLFFVITVIIINMASGSVIDRYLQNHFIETTLDIERSENTLYKAMTGPEYWEHVQKKMHRVIYDYKTDSDSTATFDYMSAAQILQVRVKQFEGECEVEQKAISVVEKSPDCSFDIELSTEETSNFVASWSHYTTRESEPGPFTFSDTDTTRAFKTLRHSYPSGGYAGKYSLGVKEPKLFDYLKQVRWIDSNTRAVKIDLVLFNPGTKLITSVQHVYEFSKVGIFRDTVESYTFPLFSSPMWNIVVNTLFVIFSFFSLIYLFVELKEVYQCGLVKYFKNPVAWLNLGERPLCFLLVYISYWDHYIREEKIKSVQELHFSDSEMAILINFHDVTFNALLIGKISCLLIILIYIKLFLKMGNIPTLSHFLRLIQQVTLLTFFPIFCILDFALLGYLLFMTITQSFSTPLSSINAIMVLIFNQGIVTTLNTISPIIGRCYIAITCSTMYYIVLNFYITFLNDAYSSIKGTREKQTQTLAQSIRLYIAGGIEKRKGKHDRELAKKKESMEAEEELEQENNLMVDDAKETRASEILDNLEFLKEKGKKSN